MKYIKSASAVDLTWRKSSYSGNNNNCVEVADGGERLAVRDSKDSAGPALLFSAEAWTSFVEGVKGCDFGADLI